MSSKPRNQEVGARRAQLRIRLAESERLMVSAAADLTGARSDSDWAREVLLEAARKAAGAERRAKFIRESARERQNNDG